MSSYDAPYYQRMRKQQRALLYRDEYTALERLVWKFFIDDVSKFGFVERVGQQDMALDITQAIRDDLSIVIEAGVGIGKSFGYLVPLIIYNQKFHKPVAIATSTIALQEQLCDDIKTVSRLLRHQVIPVVAKGQTHFVCLDRAKQSLRHKTDALSVQLHTAVFENHLYDRSSFDFSIPARVWNEINVRDYSFKTCEQCKYKSNCGFLMRRTSMRNTNGIILCNQDLLTMHLRKVGAGQTPLLNEELSLIVVDEAHNLEDKVRSAFTKYYTKRHIIQKIEKSRSLVKLRGPQFDKLQQTLLSALDSLFICFNEQITIQLASNTVQMKCAERFFLRLDDNTMAHLTEVGRLLSNIDDIIQIEMVSSYNDRHSNERNEMVSEAVSDMSTFFSSLISNGSGTLFWLEQKGQDIEIYSCPKDMARIISALYFKREYPTILTSATITNSTAGTLSEQYSYFIRNTGFPDDERFGFLSDPKPSPFPYDEHAMIYCCDDLPHPTEARDSFIKAGTERVLELLSISHGKSLILFTAKSDMEEVYVQLKEKRLPYKILMQSNDSSQDAVLNEFRRDEDSILLGSGAYWEGINIQGKSLSNLIIFRLPFPVPDPLIDYKCSIAKDKLMDVLVPEMILRCKQGIGRLIRSDEDKGVASIIDPRMGESSTARYKELVWDSLPIHNRTSSLETLRSFYSGLFCEASK